VTDVAVLHRTALDGFARRVASLGEGDWHRPTPCADWDVRALVGHVVDENRWAPPLLEGRTIADVGDELSGDPLGDDPMAAWSSSAEAAAAAVARPGALDGTAHLSFGDVPGAEYVMQLTADLLVHAWDLARGTGGDERLDQGVVAAVATWFDAMEAAYRSAGAIGPAVALPEGADEQDRLLARFGRDPRKNQNKEAQR
jgi:uncharacterized protein (TIGR03086 family)